MRGWEGSVMAFVGLRNGNSAPGRPWGSSPRGSAISGEATQRGVAPCLQVGTHRLGVPRCVFGHSPVLNQPRGCPPSTAALS